MRNLSALKKTVLSMAIMLLAVGNLFAQRGEVKILFTSDLHSCAQKYPYLATLIKQKKAEAQKDGVGVITLDAGDFSMGTLYSLFYETDAPEYRALALMGYDAFVFGNHDFDTGLKSTAYMFYNSRILGNQLNPLNGEKLVFPKNITANIGGGDNKTFSQALKYIAHTRYLIFNSGGVKVGVFGLLGKDALAVSKVSGELQFADPIDVAKDIVKALKEKGAECIVALSHSGALLREKSEDFALAKACPDIDLIISGHDHEALNEPLKVGNTTIVSVGANGDYLGEVDIKKGANGGDKSLSYKLNAVSEDITPDASAGALLELLDLKVEDLFRKRYNVSHKEVAIENCAGIKKGEIKDGVRALNYEIAKANFYMASRYKGVELDSSLIVSIVPEGVIRADLKDGKVTYQDIFNLLSLGRDARKNPGNSLVFRYLKGSDLKKVCEINTSIAPTMDDAFLTFYGLKYEYNSKGVPFRRVSKVYVHGEELDENKLYITVTDSYTAESLSLLKDKSHGLLSITPRDQNGNPTSNLANYRFDGEYYDGILNADLSEWLSFALYLKDKYSSDTNTVTAVEQISDSYSIQQAVDHPNGVSIFIFYAICALVAIALVALIFIIFKKIRRRS